MMPFFVCVARSRSQTAVGLVFGTLYVNAVDEEWRNVVGLLFLVATTLIFLSSVPLNIVFSLEWPNVAREYLSGANAMGPYLASKFIYMQPFLLGDMIMASIVFFMAGTHVASLVRIGGGHDGRGPALPARALPCFTPPLPRALWPRRAHQSA